MAYKFTEEPTKATPETLRYDGSGNNKENPNWGKANESLLRLTTPSYADGYSKPSTGRLSSTPIAAS